jgi:hypothetical protein
VTGEAYAPGMAVLPAASRRGGAAARGPAIARFFAKSGRSFE